MKTLSDYNDLLTAILKSVTDKVEFSCQPALSEIVKLPRLVVIFNHSTPLSWLPAIGLLTSEFVKSGGGDRKPLGVVDKWFFANSFTRPLAQYLTQSERPLNTDELIEKLQNSERLDLALIPEGANTFFGDNYQIQKFRSSRFVEIAVRCQAPVLIAVHKGSESWSLPLQLPTSWATFVLPFSKFFGERLQNSEPLNLPLIPRKIPRFVMACELYQPQLKRTELSDDPQLRLSQLESEAEKIHRVMDHLLETITAPPSPTSPKG